MAPVGADGATERLTRPLCPVCGWSRPIEGDG